MTNRLPLLGALDIFRVFERDEDYFRLNDSFRRENGMIIISTVLLYDDIYETMIFMNDDYRDELDMERYESEEAANEGHQRFIDKVGNGEYDGYLDGSLAIKEREWI